MSYHWRRAGTEARSLGLNYVGSDVLLLAVLRSDRTAAGAALADCGIRYAETQRLVRKWNAGADPGPIRWRPKQTPRVRRLLRISAGLAQLRGRRHAADVDVLIALMYEAGGPHTSVVQQFGTHRADVVEALGRRGVALPVAPPIPELAPHDVDVLVPAEYDPTLLEVLHARGVFDPDRYWPYGRARWGFNYTKDPAMWVFSADRAFGLPEIVEEVLASDAPPASTM